jgi:uncharacterized membrane protein YdjX (TVP38/TMEM64 family)
VTRLQRAGLVLVALATLYAVGKVSGLDQYLHAARMREAVDAAGELGPLLFVSVFVAAVVAQIPGIPFVLLAPALFSWPKAWLLCTLASNVAVLLNFELVRRIGGMPLSDLKQPLLRRILASLDARPIVAVALLRTLTIMFPPVTSALALTKLRTRDHAIGSLLGMLLPVTLLLLLSSFILRAT